MKVLKEMKVLRKENEELKSKNQWVSIENEDFEESNKTRDKN